MKARLLLEKAQRESFDQKNAHSCDEDNSQQQQQQQQQQLQSVDNTVTAVTQSSANTGEFSLCFTLVIALYFAVSYVLVKQVLFFTSVCLSVCLFACLYV